MDFKEKRLGTNKILLGLLLAVVVVLLYFWLIPDKNWQGLKVVTGQTDSIILPNGSKAILVGPSSIGFPKSFDNEVRNVKMEGEVYFDIVSNGKTFIVQSEKGGIETRSARIVINTKIKDSFMVSCITGSVRMIARGKKGIFESKILAQQKASFYKKDTEINPVHFSGIDSAIFNL